MDDATSIQIVENTLAEIMMPATYDNVNRMLGIYQTLEEVKANLKKKAGAENGRENNA